MQLRLKNSRGDTIVEVLIAISIAGLAIGTSYAIAHRAIQNAIAARERDQAVGWLENQITALKLRKLLTTDPAVFTSNFDSPNSHSHYCLISSISDQHSSDWPAQDNYAAEPLATPSQQTDPTSATAPYKSACVQDGLYYLDITRATDPNSNTTNYRLDVRWPSLGGGADNDATFYYRF
jgi:Tfp pilus assembly protein PilV